MSEECPHCETDLLVNAARATSYRWKCHGCGERWGNVPLEPIAYDDVDEWFESRSPDGTRLHADPDCPASEVFLMHTPAEARDHRHGRCLTCGHEVISQ